MVSGLPLLFVRTAVTEPDPVTCAENWLTPMSSEKLGTTVDPIGAIIGTTTDAEAPFASVPGVQPVQPFVCCLISEELPPVR